MGQLALPPRCFSRLLIQKPILVAAVDALMQLSHFLLGGLVACASAAPTTRTSSLHERRELGATHWIARDIKLNKDAVIPMSIGLTQQNLDRGYQFLMDVSDPTSKNYGKHWSMEKVCDEGLPMV
jgi:tripeptidyl-peptidase-1